MSTIQEQLSAAIVARKSSLMELRQRIADLLTAVPIGVKLSDADGLVCRVAKLYTGASQWSNQTWDVTIKGRGYITDDGCLLAKEIDGSLWDGSNMHHHSTEPYMLHLGDDQDPAGERGLVFASGKQTRALALRLPESIARYMAECDSECVANQQTMV